jgi:phosphotransacetylase
MVIERTPRPGGRLGPGGRAGRGLAGYSRPVADPSLLDQWYDQARRAPRRIVLTDGDDRRAHDAAARLEADGLARPILVDEPARHVSDGVRAAADAVATARGKPVDLSDPLDVGVLLVAAGEADGCVAGATRPTADVIRSGLRILGVADGFDAVSSSFVMVLADGRPVVYGDCGVLPDPDPTELVSVARSCAATYRQLCRPTTGEEPRVAMLSFSTHGSAHHPRVDKVRDATERVRAAEPTLAVDGELQFDAAVVESVARSKAPGSPVAGRANVFVFPDLDSGNIGYKITERLAGARAFGPVLQGLGGVLHDLSRGCSTDDIVNVAVIAALQAR